MFDDFTGLSGFLGVCALALCLIMLSPIPILWTLLVLYFLFYVFAACSED